MQHDKYDLIVVGCGSGGLSVGLGMKALGFKVLMIAKDEEDIGGECLNDGCIPSKAMIHVANIVNSAKEAEKFGLKMSGEASMDLVKAYIQNIQTTIKKHENSEWLRAQGVDVLLGTAFFHSSSSINVNDEIISGKKIVLATGSSPKKLTVRGIEMAAYYDNQTIFNIDIVPRRLLIVGSGPIGIEIAQTMCRLGTEVTVVSRSEQILPNEDKELTEILKKRLEAEGVKFYFKSELEEVLSKEKATVKLSNKESTDIFYDAIFVAIGRELFFDGLKLAHAGIKVRDKKIVVNEYLQTTAKNVYLCGDIAGDLYFSHAAEFHARILINNFLSPIKKKLNNKNFSWVTFTKPELATFGYSQKQMKDKSIDFEVIEQNFTSDDRALTDNYVEGKLLMYVSKKNLIGGQKILGGSMIAPHAGEMIQELILANSTGLSINALFNKIYPYPTASRINQSAIVNYRSKNLSRTVKKLLQFTFKIFG